MKKYISIAENIKINLSIGDEFLHGKFKNKCSIVKAFDKNEKGEDVIITDDGKTVKLLSIRLIKDETI